MSFSRANAPAAIQAAAGAYEQRFQVRFNTLSYFPKTLLSRLHRVPFAPDSQTDVLTIASEQDRTILKHMQQRHSIVGAQRILKGVSHYVAHLAIQAQRCGRGACLANGFHVDVDARDRETCFGQVDAYGAVITPNVQDRTRVGQEGKQVLRPMEVDRRLVGNLAWRWGERFIFRGYVSGRRIFHFS